MWTLIIMSLNVICDRDRESYREPFSINLFLITTHQSAKLDFPKPMTIDTIDIYSHHHFFVLGFMDASCKPLLLLERARTLNDPRS